MATLNQPLLSPEPGWDRINITVSNTTFNGSWQHRSTTTSAWQGDDHYTGDIGLVAGFNFTGPRLRIGGASGGSNGCTTIYVFIDGCYAGIIDCSVGVGWQQLKFEKLNLSEGEHCAKFIKVFGNYFYLDYIDVDANCEIRPYKQITVGVGDALPVPEPGWIRIEDNNPNIAYEGNWEVELSGTTNYSGGQGHRTLVTGQNKISFKFTGSRIRLIAPMNRSNYTKNHIVRIDGIDMGFYLNYLLSVQNQPSITFQALNLADMEHTIEIAGILLISFDAIDIAAGAEIRHINYQSFKSHIIIGR